MSENTGSNEAVLTVVKNSFNFHGRSSAGEFRTAIVVVLVFYFLVHFFSNFFTDPYLVRGLIVLAVPLVLTSQVRRLHDLGMSSLMVAPAQFIMGYTNASLMLAETGNDTPSPIIMAVACIVSIVYMLTLAFKHGTSSQNQFGLAP